jgi:hypothetical protein
MTAPSPHTTGRLPAVSPDMVEFLAVVTLHDTNLGFVRLCLNEIWPRHFSFNISWDFGVPGKVIRKRVMFIVVVPSAGDRQRVDICLTLITSKPNQPV